MERPAARLARASLAPFLSVLLSLALCLVLAACGAASGMGDTGDASSQAPAGGTTFSILTACLPAGQVAGSYPETRLETAGATGPVEWVLVAGDLPPGVELRTDGVISGCPTAPGVYAFDVAATDGVATDRRPLTLAVDAFGLHVDGLRFGEAWSGEPIALRAVGQKGEVAFEATDAESGGAFDRRDGAAGLATWIPLAGGEGVVDRIRATDLATGATAEVTLGILPHPAVGLVAEFGASDVWYVDFGGRFGKHSLPRDWDAALHELGLRSGQFVPTTADALADFYVRCRILSALNVLYGRQADGTRGAGLPISFPLERPAAPFSAPAPAECARPNSERYNVIGMVHGENSGVLGLAFLDDPGNGLVENDSPDGGEANLGVFANQVVRAYNAAFQNTTLPEDPVRAEDEDALRSLVHGRAVEGLRPTLIRRAAENFAQAVAAVLAHEIGHSLGLGHTSPVSPGSIMNGGAAIYPGARYEFVPSDLDCLRGGLPGPGRWDGPGKPASGTPIAPGGVAACSCRLRLLPPPAQAAPTAP